jgi:hypothetical protein
MIDFRDDFRNALLSILFNIESFSNKIAETELLHEKHDEPTTSTCFGTQIEAL